MQPGPALWLAYLLPPEFTNTSNAFAIYNFRCTVATVQWKRKHDSQTICNNRFYAEWVLTTSQFPSLATVDAAVSHRNSPRNSYSLLCSLNQLLPTKQMERPGKNPSQGERCHYQEKSTVPTRQHNSSSKANMEIWMNWSNLFVYMRICYIHPYVSWFQFCSV